jgi:hypothetical protein
MSEVNKISDPRKGYSPLILSTYKSTAETSIEDEINGTEPLSQFGRVLTELGVKIIYAHLPQAKGRVERMFNTLQDRLVKEMTLRGINTIE